MSIINVEGVGRVEITGDTPTPEEARTILRAQKVLGARRTPPPISDPVAPLTGDRDDEDKSGFGRAFIAGLSQAVRGFGLDTPEALEEAIPGIGYVLPQTSFRRVAEWVTGKDIHEGINDRWRKWEDDLYQPGVKGGLEEVWDEKDPAKLLQFIGEAGVNALPNMAMAMAYLPAAAYSQIGNIARQRAKNRGDGKVNVADAAIASLTAVGSAYSDKIVGRGILSKAPTGKTALRRTAATAAKAAPVEFASGALEVVGEQIGTKEGGVLGVEPKDVFWGGASEALVGAGMGGVGRAAVEVGRGPGGRAAATRYAEELAGASMPGGVRTSAQDFDPAIGKGVVRGAERAEEILEQARAESASAAKAEDALKAEVPLRGPKPEPTTPTVTLTEERAALAQALADPLSSDDAVHAKALALLASENTQERGQALAAKHADIDPAMLKAADELLMSEEAKALLTKRERIGMAEITSAAHAAGLMPEMVEGEVGLVNTPEELKALIKEINTQRYTTPSVVEQAALHASFLMHRRAGQDILDAAKVVVGKEGLDRLAERKADVNRALVEVGMALGQGGSAIGRALQARQSIATPIMTLADATAAATIEKRNTLTPTEEARIKKRWASATKLESVGLKALRTARHERLKAAVAYRRATEVKNESAMTAAESKLDKAENDMVKAAAVIRRAEREKSGLPRESLGSAALNPLIRKYKQAFGASIVLSSSGDDSALGRQALGLVLQNPVMAVKTLPIAYQLAPWSKANRAFAQRAQRAILNSDMQAIRRLAGLELTEVEGLSDTPGMGMLAREELFMFRVLETGAIGDALVIPSQNAFALTLNMLRASNFDHGVRLLAEAHGADPKDLKEIRDKVPVDDMKALALLINASTGRGDWGSGTGVLSRIARNTMFAPRFTLSRFETPWRAAQAVLGMGKFANISPQARDLFRRRVGRQMGWLVSMGIMASMLGPDDPEEGAKTFVNPMSPDFLKLRVGDYHIDLTGGISSSWRYVLQLVVPDSRPDAAMGRMVRNKLAPLMGMFWDMYRGTDFRGRKVTEDAMKTDREMQQAFNTKIDNWISIALHRYAFPAAGAFTPITVQNLAEEAWSQMADKDKDEFQRVLPVILDAFGVGARHYKATKR